MEKNNAMRKRDPKHEVSLNALIGLQPDQIKQQLLIDDYQHPDYVASEVLASLVRARYGKQSDLLEMITRAFHKRVIKGIQHCINRQETLRNLALSDNEFVGEATSYFWEKFSEDVQTVSNAEVRFWVYLQNKICDFKKHLQIEENTRLSIDSFTAADEESDSSNYIDTIVDESNDPEINAMRSQDKSRLMSTLMRLPQKERNAFYFRVECEYDWVKVAQLLECSIPTARSLLNLSIEKLQGALK